MPMRTIYCDESGFTGYNLLDPRQPIFAVASASIDEQRAEAILRESFPNYQGAEFKFSNVWGSKNRAGLLKFVGYLDADLRGPGGGTQTIPDWGRAKSHGGTRHGE